MARYKISDVLFLGSQVGVTAIELEVSHDENFTSVFNHRKVEQRGIMEIFSDMSFGNYTHKGNQLYWNGDTKIYIRIRLYMDSKPTDWFEVEWEPDVRDYNGNKMPPTNPINMLDLNGHDGDHYCRHTKLAISRLH